MLAKGVQYMAIVNVQHTVLDMLAETKATPMVNNTVRSRCELPLRSTVTILSRLTMQ